MTILQRSEDWHADRCGKVTASRIKDVDAKPIKGKAHNALTLTILTERLTGVQEETKTTGPMQWGIDQEPYAIAAYENETGSLPHRQLRRLIADGDFGENSSLPHRQLRSFAEGY